MIREAMQFLTGLKEEAMEPKVVEIAERHIVIRIYRDMMKNLRQKRSLHQHLLQ